MLTDELMPTCSTVGCLAGPSVNWLGIPRSGSSSGPHPNVGQQAFQLAGWAPYPIGNLAAIIWPSTRMATSQGCSGSHPPEYHCSGCDLIGQQYRFMLAAWAHPIGCHSVYIWAHCSGVHLIATHTDYPRWSGSHPIAIWYISGLAIRACTHAAPVGLSPDCHSLDIWSRCSGAHPSATHTFSPVRLSPDCHSGVHPIATHVIFTCQSGSHPIALRYIFVLAIWACTQLLPVQHRSGSHPIAI